MYKLEFLPIAKNDIDNIIYYISNILENKTAAIKMAQSFLESANKILEFPYGLAEYKLNFKLSNRYRCFKIKNFLMFYTINEEEKIITIVRVLYQKMDIDKILN